MSFQWLKRVNKHAPMEVHSRLESTIFATTKNIILQVDASLLTKPVPKCFNNYIMDTLEDNEGWILYRVDVRGEGFSMTMISKRLQTARYYVLSPQCCLKCKLPPYLWTFVSRQLQWYTYWWLSNSYTGHLWFQSITSKLIHKVKVQVTQTPCRATVWYQR